MAQNPLTPILTTPPSIPLYLRRFAVAVEYLAEQPVENQDALEDAISDFQNGLQLGFFAWAHFPQRHAAELTIEWTDTGFVLHGETDGMHHNGLVALLRLIVNLHHTPAEARASIVAALGDDAGALPPPSVFSETVKSVRFEAIEGADISVSGRSDFNHFIADDEIAAVDAPAFANPGETWDGDRIVLAAKRAFDQDDFDEVEDTFLRLFDMGCFVGLDTIDEMAGDPEFFLRQREDETQLIIDDYDGEVYGLIEFLNVLSDGATSVFSAGVEE